MPMFSKKAVVWAADVGSRLDAMVLFLNHQGELQGQIFYQRRVNFNLNSSTNFMIVIQRPAVILFKNLNEIVNAYENNYNIKTGRS